MTLSFKYSFICDCRKILHNTHCHFMNSWNLGECQKCLPQDCLPVGNPEVGNFQLTHHQECLRPAPVILDILTFLFIFLEPCGVNYWNQSVIYSNIWFKYFWYGISIKEQMLVFSYLIPNQNMYL